MILLAFGAKCNWGRAPQDVNSGWPELPNRLPLSSEARATLPRHEVEWVRKVRRVRARCSSAGIIVGSPLGDGLVEVEEDIANGRPGGLFGEDAGIEVCRAGRFA